MVVDNYQYYIERQNRAPKIPCECGCGELIPSITRRGYPARFKNGHTQMGKLHFRWNGGRTKRDGYWLVLKKDHHFANRDGYVLEHRLVYEEYYNCCLLPWCDIHHINEIKDDNRIENLKLIGTRSDHVKHHKQPIDMENRICLLCDSKKTGLKKDRPHWYKFETGVICSKCYMKNYDALYRKK